jgi:hypothetical protein
MLAHEPLDALMITPLALAPQLLRHPGTTIAAFLLAMNSVDLLGQQPIGYLASRLLAVAPGIVTTTRNLQHGTQFPHRVVLIPLL